MNKEEEFKDWLSQIRNRIKERGLISQEETAEAYLNVFDVKNVGKVTLSDFTYTVAALGHHIVKRDLISLFNYLDSNTGDEILDSKDFETRFMENKYRNRGFESKRESEADV